jgi:hypothetical protein
VLRASVFSIVVLLAVGQNTAVLCGLWCQPGGAAMAHCHEQAGSSTSPTLRGDDRCGGMVAAAATLIREDLRRVSDHGARYSVVVPRYLVPALPSEALGAAALRRASPLDSQPLFLALRI